MTPFDPTAYPFLQATFPRNGINLTGQPDRRITVAVIHCTETPLNSAHAVAKNCAAPSGRVGAPHWVCGGDGIWHTAQERDVVYGAKGCNQHGLHFELCGEAAWSEDMWAQADVVTMLEQGGVLVGNRCAAHGIPLRWMDPAQLRTHAAHGWPNNGGGIVSHATVTKAFPPGTGHWDPGPHFPYDTFLGFVTAP